ncbi:MAG: hypothetical protein IJ507_07120 [Clostridia bacterium]|nr:hypothetical protein [Clostridia bacterium]
MDKLNWSKVVPFRLSASRMRRSADEMRRRGQLVESMEMLRRAAVQEDSSALWLQLARRLRQEGCPEQAVPMLYRLCGREDMPADAWLELGLGLRTLGRRDAACDCLYHYLHENPYSSGADQARRLLQEMEQYEGVKDPFRLDPLVRRGLTAWRRGDTELGGRRLRRAIRMGRDKAKLHITLGILYLADERGAEALRELARALKAERGNVRAMCMSAVTLSSLGKRRMAMAMLERSMPLAVSPEDEEHFITAAWAISARRLIRRYLDMRLKAQPLRIALMHPMADLLWHSGEHDTALRWWKRILALDPCDPRARALISWAPEHPDSVLPRPGTLPGDYVRAQLAEMKELTLSPRPPEELLCCGSQSRMLLDWCFRMPDENLQQAALWIAMRKDSPQTRLYLRQLLTLPGVMESVRQRAMMELAQHGENGAMNVLMGTRITSAQLSPVKDTRQNLWKLFLPQLLRETRRTCPASDLAVFAADLWQLLGLKHRHDAAGPGCYLWVKAMEIMFLRLTHQEAEADRVLRTGSVSPRKIRRVLNQIARELDLYLEGDHPDEKVH